MHTKRIIPCLDVKGGRVVKGVNFVNLIDAGDPVAIGAAYDKAGNMKEIWIYQDGTVPVFEGTGKVGGEDTELVDGGYYQSVAL